MMYQTLAPYYDALVSDETTLQSWVEFVKKYKTKGSILELACGSGELALHLAQDGYQVDASDVSQAMLDIAKAKEHAHLVHWHHHDMREIQGDKTYDAILCFCDSLNYMLEESEICTILNNSYAQLREGGVFLFDMHTPDRLVEFDEEYIEEGIVKNMQYQWTITAEDAYIYQVFAFYDEKANAHVEYHKQRVYQAQWIQQQATSCGFQVEIYTDFDTAGIQEGEKYFFVCKKEGTI